MTRTPPTQNLPPLPTLRRRWAPAFISLRTRLLVTFTLLFLLTAVGFFSWLHIFAGQVATDNLTRDVGTAALTTALGIDGDAHQRLARSGRIDDADYRQISAYLRSVRRTNPKASGLYTYVADPQRSGQVRLVVSASLPPGQPFSLADTLVRNLAPANCRLLQDHRPALGQRYDPAGSRMMGGLKTGAVDSGTFTDAWGTWLSGYAPIRNSRGVIVAAVGIDMCAAAIQQVQQQVSATLLPVFGVMLLFFILAVYLIATRITRPLLGLAAVAAGVGRGVYSQDFGPLQQVRIQDEVSTLAGIIEQMTGQIKAREDSLRGQVQELLIEIDEAKRHKQVKDIVESEFFRELKEKAEKMRQRSRRS
jgi:hypothetical protein